MKILWQIVKSTWLVEYASIMITTGQRVVDQYTLCVLERIVPHEIVHSPNEIIYVLIT